MASVVAMQQKFALAGAPSLFIEDRIAIQALATIALHWAQIHREGALGVDGQSPFDGNANRNAFVEATFAKTGGGYICLGGENAYLNAGGEAAAYLEGNAAVARQVLPRAQDEIELIPG